MPSFQITETILCEVTFTSTVDADSESDAVDLHYEGHSEQPGEPSIGDSRQTITISAAPVEPIPAMPAHPFARGVG